MFNLEEAEGLSALSEFASLSTEDEIEELYEILKELKDKEKYFIINVNGKKYKVVTDHAYLELERIRKNNLLKTSINKQVKVKGIVNNVKVYRNTSLFCLSPCEINGVDIGHTWVMYSPVFKHVKFGATVTFYSEIKKYGDFNNKSGVNWQEIAYARIKGGSNESLHNIPLKIMKISSVSGESDKTIYNEFKKEIPQIPSSITYEPSGRDSFSLRELIFKNEMIEEGAVTFDEYGRLQRTEDKTIKIKYKTLEQSLVFNSKYLIIADKETQHKLDLLIFFEWLVNLEDWEFWGYVGNKRY